MKEDFFMYINKNLNDFKDTFIDLVKKIYKQKRFSSKTIPLSKWWENYYLITI